MQIEIMEDMNICKLSDAKGDIEPGTPIAVFCDDEEDIKEAANIDFTQIKNCYEIEKYMKNPIYSSIPLSVAMWQAYATERQTGCS